MSAQRKIKRKPLTKGNEYFTDPSKSCRFRISDPLFHGPNPGVAVQWLAVGGDISKGQFFLCRDASEFWSLLKFQNAIDAEDE
jgi:hypothetical protein